MDERLPVPEQVKPRRRLRQLAAFAVLALGVAAISPLVTKAPRDRDLDIRLRDPASITAIETTWTRDGTPVRGTENRFPIRNAPDSLRMTLRLPDGRYDVDLVVERMAFLTPPKHADARSATEARERTPIHRTVTLDADTLTLDLR